MEKRTLTGPASDLDTRQPTTDTCLILKMENGMRVL